jgi:hypothetical protein
MSRRDVLDGFVPRRPPAELRERVLGAAREAAARQQSPLLERLWLDGMIRWTLGVAILLALANAALTVRSPENAAPPAIELLPSALRGEDRALPSDGGTAAADQLRKSPPLARECGVARG